MTSDVSSSPDQTVVARPVGERVLVWCGAPLLGAGAGWLLKVVADWATSLPWTPFQKPLELIASLPAGPVTIAVVALGSVAGLVVAFLAERDYVTVVVDDDQVTIAYRESRREVRRASIEAVFLDRKRLVLLGHATEELVRQTGDLPDAKRLSDAFQAHGYPWRSGGDPHGNDFRRWVADHPDLSAAAHAFLKARERALDQGDGGDAEQLRAELAEHGIVVREEGKRQYWRRTNQASESSDDLGG
ncbi:hypothetical protein ABT294_21325 [Nonomuraea sp. NPDC000554]|uniref:YqeB family protein n=1 Tax=Nonomuraea sp. NPDC000554 TaxID=3154259 RepID=UPI0033341341